MFCHDVGDVLEHLKREHIEVRGTLITVSIEEIALDVGYENQGYFFRQFKKHYGMTPHKCRKEKIKDKKRY